MKILTITCHRPHNYGAVLQAYALNRFLQKRGHDARVIDYTSKSHGGISDKYKNNLLAKAVRGILLFPDRLKGNKVFGEFIKNNISLTERSYFSHRELVDNPPSADLYITGSDQVWNCDIPVGKDDAYFLDFSGPNAKKISYAASMATDLLPDNQKKRYYNLLYDFHAISVREPSSVSILKSIGIDAVSVLDPVYLLDKREWVDLAEKADYKEPYVLVYSFNRQKNVFDFAKKIAKEKNLKVYSVNTRWLDIINRTDKYFWSVSPQKFLSLILNADIVVTNSFHGISFSIIFEKYFFAFTKETGNSRIIDLLKSLHLEDRLLKNNLQENPVDYKKVNALLDELKNSSVDFLEKNLI